MPPMRFWSKGTARSLVVLLLVVAGACGRDDEPERTAQAAGTPAAIASAPPRDKRAPQSPAQLARQGFPDQLPRGRSDDLRAATLALEAGDAAAATRALLALGDDLDSELLRARLAALEGDGIDAVRRLERARATWPDQSAVYATAAEIHAWAGRRASAEEEIRTGLSLCGPTPELSRARGVLALSREGGARAGLNHLLDAHAVDPDLPFLAPPLCSAHLLLGHAALADSLAVDALGHARAVLLLEPGNVEARTLQADAQA